MEILALLSNRDDVVISQVKGALKQYTVYPLKTMDELEDLYSNIPLNLLLIDTLSHRLSTLGDFLNKLDNDSVILITSEKLDKFAKSDLPPSVFETIDDGSIKTDLVSIIERGLERQRFKNELRLLRRSHDMIPLSQTNASIKPETDVFSGRGEHVPGVRLVQEKVIVNFAKMLAASFDTRKLFDHFIDSVMEIACVNKMSIMLRDKNLFYVKTHYGLDPHLAENMQLKKDGALASWLGKTGRIMNKPTSFFDAHSASIRNEMDFLQCSVSFPMMHKGKLIGIFNIDKKITEEPFYSGELEIIYLLCNYLAAAVKDIDLYHHIWYQKEFTDNILSSMSSGMIAISKEEKVTVFNQQASEILKLESSAVVGRDLRALPSPLGDILYETMVTGNTCRNHEVTINPLNLPIGINSFRLHDEQRNAVGAGIVFSDLSDSKKLEEQKRMAEKLQAVNDLMGKIAHEVRNPLTSIQTYIQLLDEKRIDDDLHSFYVSTVSQSIHRLDRLIDKFITFSNTQDYNFSKEEVNDFIASTADTISKSLPPTHRVVKKSIENTVYINIDKKQMIKSIYYLVQNIVDRTPQGVLIEMSVNRAFDTYSVEIPIAYEGEKPLQEGTKNFLKPLLDIKNLETELNFPIAHKIIEGHNGTLNIKREGNSNIFVIRLPIIDRRGSEVSFKGGYVSEQ